MSLTFDGPTARALIASRNGQRFRFAGGSHNPKRATNDEIIRRLCNGLDSAEDGECWLWVMSGNGRGYGQISVNGYPARTHVLAFQVAHGDIPKGLCVLHDCDVKRCINPSHLHLGTIADNTREYRERFTAFIPHRRGEDHYHSKLTAQDVIVIRRRLADGESTASIAPTYQVTPQAISLIKRGKNWAHVMESL